MKSKASIKSHPIHPILVAFPITLFIATFVFDVLWATTGNQNFGKTSLYLNIGGIGFALLAAIPGIIDYYFTVPPESSAKKRAAKHGLLNAAVTILFVIALLFRLEYAERNVNVLIFVIEVVAIALLMIAGWLGGTLVNRNQIGIDIRYANAGKWQDKRIQTHEKYVLVANIDELEINQMKLIQVNGKRIVIGRTASGYTAFDDRCTHKGGSLASGIMICSTVQCPWHGSQFDVQSGALAAGPAKENIPVYKINVVKENVYLEI